ncbi:hypothetical protein GJAV_G00103960 [Gymnothorax javanicus]|nr:hypothetical protein GJAV_G00103960 [Gymnothorax javanicus]
MRTSRLEENSSEVHPEAGTRQQEVKLSRNRKLGATRKKKEVRRWEDFVRRRIRGVGEEPRVHLTNSRGAAGVHPSLQGGEREPGARSQRDARNERVLAQDWLLCGRQTPAEEEEEAEDRSQHDRGAHELHSPDARWLRGDDRGAAAVWAGPGTDEVKRPQCQWPEKPVIAGSWTYSGSLCPSTMSLARPRLHPV